MLLTCFLVMLRGEMLGFFNFRYHLLVAFGQASPDGTLSYHNTDKTVSQHSKGAKECGIFAPDLR